MSAQLLSRDHGHGAIGGGCPFFRSLGSAGAHDVPLLDTSPPVPLSPPIVPVPTPVLSSIPQIQFLPDAVLIVVESGAIIDCNASASTTFGYSHEELLALSIHELVPLKYRDSHHLRTAEVFSTMMPREMSKRRNVQVCPKSGRCFEVSIHLSPAYLRSSISESQIDHSSSSGASLVERTSLRKIVTCVVRDMRLHNAMVRRHNEAEQRVSNTESFLRLLNHEVRTGMHGVMNALATVKEEMVSFIRRSGVAIEPQWLREDPLQVHPEPILAAGLVETVELEVLRPLSNKLVKDLAEELQEVQGMMSSPTASTLGLSSPLSPVRLPLVGHHPEVTVTSSPVSSVGSIATFSPLSSPLSPSIPASSPRSAVRSLLMLEAGVSGMDMLFRNLLDYRGLLDNSVVSLPMALDLRHFLVTLKHNHRARWVTKGQTVLVSVPHDLPLVVVDVALLTKLIECLLDNCVKHAGSGARILLECTVLDDSSPSPPSPAVTLAHSSSSPDLAGQLSLDLHSLVQSPPSSRQRELEMLEQLLLSPPPPAQRSSRTAHVMSSLHGSGSDGFASRSSQADSEGYAHVVRSTLTPTASSSPGGAFKHVVIQQAATQQLSGTPSPVAKITDPAALQSLPQQTDVDDKALHAATPGAGAGAAKGASIGRHLGSESAEMRVRTLVGGRAGDAASTAAAMAAEAEAASAAAETPTSVGHNAPTPAVQSSFPSFVSFLLSGRGSSSVNLAPPSAGSSIMSNEEREYVVDWPSPLSANGSRRLAVLRGASTPATPEAALLQPLVRRLQFVVCDTGVGIPSSVLSAIEEEILNADASSTRATSGGVGLGLHIAKMCAKKLRATLTLSSRHHLGQELVGPQPKRLDRDGWMTAFSFIAPFQVVPNSSQIQQQHQSASVASSVESTPVAAASSELEAVANELQSFRSLSNPQRQRSIVARLLSSEFTVARSSFRIVIVEDNAINIKVLQRMCSRHGFTNIQVCVNGQIAVDDYKVMQQQQQQPEPPALFLMDCEMPCKDGWEATKELRQMGCMAPIFALTANATQQGQNRCRQAGCDLFLTKPASAQTLLFAIAALPPFELYPLEYCPHVLIPAAFAMPPIHEVDSE